MSGLDTLLLDHTDELIERWYRAWRSSTHPHHAVSETLLKDSLGIQLVHIGHALRDPTPPDPEQMWKDGGRLDPEARVHERIPIEDMVQGYGLLLAAVRDWIDERGLEVPFKASAYFHDAVFELVAESVRRYSLHQAGLVRQDRARYLAGLMHQLRTPLTAVSLQVEVLARSFRPAAPDEVARLRRNVGRIRRLVDAVLRLERFDPEEVPVHPVDLDVSELVDGVLRDHHREATDKGLRLEAHVDRSLRASVDYDLVVDALGNLVHNAVRYTAAGVVRIEVDAVGADLRFRVTDTGPGIPPDRLGRLFVDAQPGSVGGAGIGLQIAAHAAHALGGTVRVESEVGRGSRFTLTIPSEVASRGAPPADRAA